MRYLVISDIHGNLEALDAVLADAAGHYRHVLMLGDLVGYGADPNAVTERVRALPAATVIRGNHDKVAVGLDSAEDFNYLARHAITWTGQVLTPENHAWLTRLPEGPVAIDDVVEICHGAPFDEDVYIFDQHEARRALDAASRPLCLFGHTHVPAAFALDGELHVIGQPLPTPGAIHLQGSARYIVNCGAVGQPRDGSPLASYGVFDSETRTLAIRRTTYDIATAQRKILAAGLPEPLAQRLAVGR